MREPSGHEKANASLWVDDTSRLPIPSVLTQKFLSTWRVNFQRPTAEAFDGRQDIIGRFGPAQRFRIGVLLGKERLDGGDEVLDRLMRPALDLLFGQQREEAFDLCRPIASKPPRMMVRRLLKSWATPPVS